MKTRTTIDWMEFCSLADMGFRMKYGDQMSVKNFWEFKNKDGSPAALPDHIEVETEMEKKKGEFFEYF